ncbi:MAG TPA: metal-dependent hydrolase [Rhodocyclaceae bacterium]|nr:metal-dependent hydrolase [Rhodocyclaceae bacterium]
MDIVTQGLLGAAAAQSASSSRHVRLAALTGFAAGLLPDADTLIRSDADPLLVIEYHRHFTHALPFVPVGALVAALLLWPLLRRHLSFAQVYGYAFLGYLTHGFLDACTSYGTRLLWPVSDVPISWSIVAVVDPVFSGCLLAGLIAAWWLRERRWGWLGLALAGAYLVFGAVQHQRALDVAEALAQDRGQTPERVLVKPTMGNVLLWRAVAVDGAVAHIDAVRIGPAGGSKVYQGRTAELIDPARWQDLPADSVAYRELSRFHGYSDGLLVAHPDAPGYVGDLRYSMLPTEIAPLWGIVLDASRPDEPIDFVARREFTPQMRRAFIDMLRGR